MSSPGSRNVVIRDDIETAQEVLDAWAGHLQERQAAADAGLPMLRGLITQALADKRGEGHSDGYSLGLLEGRRQVANAVRDALDGEGL